MIKSKITKVALFSLVSCSVVFAADGPVSSKVISAKTSVSAISDNNYFRKDQQTGLVKLPPANYYQKIEELNLNQSDEGLKVEVMADGSERVNLQGRFMMHSAVINKNGETRHICVNHTKDIHTVKPSLKRAVK
jgi:hypothetical protein